MTRLKQGMRYLLPILLICALFWGNAPLTAHADTAPKPSVHVSFSGIVGECYGTLLAPWSTNGPYHAVEQPDALLTEEEEEALQEQLRVDGITRDIWEAFVRYEDGDGFYYLQTTWHCSDDNGIHWTYYPPNTFKVLLYFPETGQFVSSGTLNAYAFHSHFAVTAGAQTLTATRDHPFAAELLSFGCRVLITIASELALALLFALRERRVLLTILATNVLTQIALNIALDLICFAEGPLMFVVAFVLLELLVTAIEAVVYAVLLPRLSTRRISRLRAIGYALCANVLSFGAGMAISVLLPGIFF